MSKWLLAVVTAAGLSSPALAQPLPDRPVTQIGDFDKAPIEEGLRAFRKGGACDVAYVVGVNGKAKDIAVQCTVPDMDPYVMKSIERAMWEPEVFAGQVFDSHILHAAFRFGTYVPVDPRGEKPPALVRNLSDADLRDALIKTPGKLERCDVTFDVGADGRPKNIIPNCKPATLDPLITAIVGRMSYTPGEKDGQPADWPGISMPMEFVELARQAVAK